ncbi:MAG: hypothetical protein Q7S14_00135 [bacterium]|nr:hypothetical protein [bacterium]
MIDLDFIDVARWLSEPISDPVAFENWIGNSLYGVDVESNEVWERAVAVAILFKEKPPVGIAKIGDWGTFICPQGPADEVEVDKIKIPKNTIYIIKATKEETKKLKIKLHGKLRIDNKNSFTIDVTGGEIGIIIDTYGR